MAKAGFNELKITLHAGRNLPIMDKNRFSKGVGHVGVRAHVLRFQQAVKSPRHPELQWLPSLPTSDNTNRR